MTALLELYDVTKRFGGLTAVKGVTFKLEKGELTGILGPNGAGKTTLFNLLTGFIAPTSGTITFNGEQLRGLAPYKIVNRGMARTFQLTRPFVGMNLLENGWWLHVAARATTTRTRRNAPAICSNRSASAAARRSRSRPCQRRPAAARDRPGARDPPDVLLLTSPSPARQQRDRAPASMIRRLHREEHLTTSDRAQLASSWRWSRA